MLQFTSWGKPAYGAFRHLKLSSFFFSMKTKRILSAGLLIAIDSRCLSPKSPPAENPKNRFAQPLPAPLGAWCG
jgi:hypothetical protein